MTLVRRTVKSSVVLRYQRLTFQAKAAICFLLLFYACLIAFMALVTPARIAQFMYDLAVEIRRLPYGHSILVAAIILISFPPFVGHTTLLNLCGFTYGMQGFIPAAIATVAGSALVFVILRSLFSDRLRKWTSTNEKWEALEAVIVSVTSSHFIPYLHCVEQRTRGLPLIILIRISSFPPWVYSNSLFASIESVSLTQFAFATLFVLPRVMVYVFMGSRIASLSDGEQRSRMDTTTKLVNASLVVGSIVISVISSFVVYYFVRKEIESLHGDTGADALEDAEEACLLARS